MLWEIELLYFVAMIAVFIVLLLAFKVPAGISLMVSAVVGAILSLIFSDTDISIRHFVEGGFGYFDTILVITTAMIFIGGLETCGALDYISALLIKAFNKVPTILLIFFMLIIMLPGMITGSSLASVVSAGAIVAPIMIKMKLPKGKVGAIIAFGAILGMIAPPINIPVMVICDVVDIPYTGFTLPLLVLTLPLAIFCVLFLGRKYRRSEDEETFDNKTSITKNIITIALLLMGLVINLVILLNSGEKELLLSFSKQFLIIYIIFSLVVLFITFFNKNKGKTNKIENSIITGFLGGIIIFLIGSTIIYINKSISLPSNIDYLNTAKLLSKLTIIFAALYVLIWFVIFYGRPYSDKINLEEMGETIDLNITHKLNFTVLIPFIVLILLFIGQSVFPRTIGMLGTPLIFVIAFIFTTFLGRKKNVIKVVKDGVKKSFSAMGLLMGVGMFIQIMTLNGVRGYFVINALSLPSIWQYVSIALTMPLFGGISAFGSASILGGPFVMALLQFNEIIVASGLSLVAATGEFLPPTAMSANFAAKVVGEEKYSFVTKNALIPLGVTIAYAMIFIIVVAGVWA